MLAPRSSYLLSPENLLKAIIVAQGKDPIGANGAISGWFATHNLITLAEHAEVAGLPEPVLAQLTDFIRAGKYPVALRDGEAPRAHSYFPYNVLADVAKLLPALEGALAALPVRRDTLPEADLLTLCTGPIDDPSFEERDAEQGVGADEPQL